MVMAFLLSFFPRTRDFVRVVTAGGRGRGVPVQLGGGRINDKGWAGEEEDEEDEEETEDESFPSSCPFLPPGLNEQKTTSRS